MARNLRFASTEEFNAYMARLKSPAAVATDTSTKRGPKYGNKRTQTLDGIVHDSGKEARRWEELRLRERAGEITGLRRQVPFALVVNGVLVCSYEADAVYVEGAATIVEDTKSEPTRKKRDYRIKVKLMQAIHGIQVREV